MKLKFTILRESSYDITNGHSSYEKVRTFKNEQDAIGFYNDPKNLRIYGSMFMEMRDEAGKNYDWSDSEKKWIPA